MVTRSVRILIVASRSPWPPYTGDRLRTNSWAEALRGADVVVAGPGGSRVDVPVARSMTAVAAAGVRVLRDGLPRHVLLGARDWRSALQAAGNFDVAIVVLTRTEPWVREAIRAERRILDVVDSAACAMRERRRAAGGTTRGFWRREELRSSALERELLPHYESVVTVSREEATLFGNKGVAIPAGVEIRPPGETPRVFDYGFTGRLGFYANEEAVRLLVREIWPRVRAERSRATLLLGGADAPRWIRRLHGIDGIHVESPMLDRAATLRRVRIAILPVMFGSGQSMKALEAAEAGCGIVATRCALRGAEELISIAAVEESPDALAAKALERFADETSGAALREVVVRRYSREATYEEMKQLVEGPH